MYEYKFVTLEFKVFSKRPDYHEVIEQHASEGWRFVQIFSPTFVWGQEAKRNFMNLYLKEKRVKKKHLLLN